MSDQSRDLRRSLLDLHTDRRRILKGSAGAAAGLAALGIFGGIGAMPSPGSSRPLGLEFQSETPADQAPASNQVYRVPSDPTTVKAFDFYETVYNRPLIADLFSDPLVRLNKNFEIVPGAALKWSLSADGKTWTFNLDPNLVWSDGNPVTAQDWVKTFQYSADPKHAWDFTWYWLPDIVGYADAVNGKVPLDKIGVRQGSSPQELIFDTLVPSPYLPAKLLYSVPLAAAALNKTGPLYNTKPETAVSSGPFILDEWVRDQYVSYKRNTTYKGSLQPIPFQKVIVKLAAPNTWFTLYQTGEIDYSEQPAPADIKVAQADPQMSKELYQGVGDFRVDYLFFDVTKPPFNNLKVRQAFSHVIDRDAIKEKILGLQGNPSFGFLAPGYPASNQDALKGIQNFDPAKGQQLLAEAGFPNGKGFPKLELWLRAPTPTDSAVGGATGAMLKQHLNIDVSISPRDSATFTSALDAKPTQILFGFVSYGMDYFDTSNMLGVWLTGGRHSWSNPQYDALVKKATSFLGSTAERTQMFQQAEKMLVSDVPAVFIYYRTPIQFVKSYVKGDALTPDKNKIKAIHWPGYATMATVPEGLYITKDAPANRT